MDNVGRIGVVYLARGAAPAYGDPTWQGRIERFAQSWRKHPPGADCTLYVSMREFTTIHALRWTLEQFEMIRPVLLMRNMAINPYWGAAYIEAAETMTEEHICVLNTSSEIRCDGWLEKMVTVYKQPAVGLVGASGSFHSGIFEKTLAYPNTHIRGATFLLNRDTFLHIARQFAFDGSGGYAGKEGGLAMEHGPNSMTKQILDGGQRVMVVGRDGIGLEPAQWPAPITYSNLENVLVWDVSALRR